MSTTSSFYRENAAAVQHAREELNRLMESVREDRQRVAFVKDGQYVVVKGRDSTVVTPSASPSGEEGK